METIKPTTANKQHKNSYIAMPVGKDFVRYCKGDLEKTAANLIGPDAYSLELTVLAARGAV